MSVPMPSIRRLFLIPILILGGVACSTPHEKARSANTTAPSAGATAGPASAASPASAAAPWTDAFSVSTALLAAEVRIEGPPGLISHVASVSDPEELDRKEKTTPEGFLQVISVKPEARGARITAQLDRLAIVALERLTILERPGATTVVVTAKGDVYWENPKTGEVKRGDTLRFDGKIGEKAAR